MNRATSRRRGATCLLLVLVAPLLRAEEAGIEWVEVRTGFDERGSVAVLGSATLDVTTIIPASIVLAGFAVTKGEDGTLSFLADVNHDGFPDLVVHAPLCATADPLLYATTYDGRSVRGTRRADRPSRTGISARKAPVLRVGVDVGPGDASNVVDAGTEEPLAVAILSRGGFDPMRVDPSTVNLSGSPALPSAIAKDVDGDSLPDLVVRVARERMRFAPGARVVTLYALTYDGQAVEGSDSIRLAGTRTLTFESSPASKGEPAHAEFASPVAIAIQDDSAAAPYPSTIAVSGLSGVVSHLSVSLKGFGHTFPADVDVLLVGPGGQSVRLLSDAGGTAAVSGATLTFDDNADATIPVAGPVASGFYDPSEYDAASDPFPLPAPTPSPADSLAIFDGTNPNGSWSLFVLDDTAGDVGAISGGWSLDFVLAASFCNTGKITINDAAVAAPYPSSIVVASVSGQVISKVAVTLDGLRHPLPRDLDILLVGPLGQKVILMSDAGGPGSATSGVVLTIDDDAASPFPAPASPLGSGAYRPTDNEPGDALPAPAPGTPYATTLSTFDGTDPNGTWKLYVLDDTGTNSGSIEGGWCLTLTLVAPASGCNPSALTIHDQAPADPYPSSIVVSGVAGVVARATVTLDGLSHTFPQDLDVLLVGPAGQRLVLMSDVGGAGPGVSGVTLTFADGSPSLDVATNPVSGTYAPTNDGGGDVFPAPAPGTSAAIALAVFNGTNPNGTWSLYVVDDIGGDAGMLGGGWCLTLTLAYAPSPPSCNAGPITVPAGAPGTTSGPAGPYPSSVAVAGIGTPVGKVRVTLNGLTHANASDLDVLLVSPHGDRVVLMSDAGGGAAVSNASVTFDDDAVASLPDAAPIASGAYRPANFAPDESLPAPAPAGPYPEAPSLATFAGSDPNGTWSLYVFDDAAPQTGAIAGGWCLEILPPEGTPGETFLTWDASLTKDQLRWTAAPFADSYHLYMGIPVNLRRVLNCEADSLLRLVTSDLHADNGMSEIPEAGSFFWYIARGANPGGEGTAGRARVGSVGIERFQNVSPLCSCAHEKCTVGGPLASGCDPCVTTVCATDSFCCTDSWDGTCVGEAFTLCASLACTDTTGGCAHAPCSPGPALVAGCDAPPVSPSCVARVCSADPFCCGLSWDSVCVGEVNVLCAPYNCD